MTERTYIIATPKPWNLAEFKRLRGTLPGRWLVAKNPHELIAALDEVSPRYIFFPHWSHLVPTEIIDRQECVCFHMTDLPFGRGGSPLQNLIERGHNETMLTALRMTDVLDAGPVYAKRPLSLEGSAKQIFVRAGKLIFEMIGWIVANEPKPHPQQGKPTLFIRRKPNQSRLPDGADARKLYDHIRMLDAPGYPRAFTIHGGWQLEFDRARLDGESVEARVRFTKLEGNGQ